MKFETLLATLRRFAPEETAIEGDPVGMLIESSSPDVRTVMVCLDATPHVVDVAVEEGAQLIIAHHPLIYHPLRRLERGDPVGAVVMSLVERGIGLYAMHTNWDLADGGINDVLAEQIGLTNVKRLPGSPLLKLARIGELARPLPPETFLGEVADRLDCTGTSALRDARLRDEGKSIKRVGVCGGAGAELAADMIAAGMDAFVTADVRHHEFLAASAQGLLLVDAGHEATEAPGMQRLAKTLASNFPELYVKFVPNCPRG